MHEELCAPAILPSAHLFPDLWSRYRAGRRQRRRVLLSMSRGPSSSGRPPSDMTLPNRHDPAYLYPHTPIHLIAVLQCIVFVSLCPIFHSAMTCVCALSQRKDIFREKPGLVMLETTIKVTMCSLGVGLSRRSHSCSQSSAWASMTSMDPSPSRDFTWLRWKATYRHHTSGRDRGIKNQVQTKCRPNRPLKIVCSQSSIDVYSFPRCEFHTLLVGEVP